MEQPSCHDGPLPVHAEARSPCLLWPSWPADMQSAVLVETPDNTHLLGWATTTER